MVNINALWGKKSSNGEPKWLPLVVHLADTAEIGKLLWDEWLCDGAKHNIAENCIFAGSPAEDEKLRQARALFVFLCAAHDLGKATPAFQGKPSHITWDQPCEIELRRSAANDMDDKYRQRLLDGEFLLPTSKEWSPGNVPHACASQIIAELNGVSRNIAAILGAHHGQSLNDNDIEGQIYSGIIQHPRDYYTGEKEKGAWISSWQEILSYAFEVSELFQSADELPIPNLNAAFLLDSLLIMADWIASNEELCPYIHFEFSMEQISKNDSIKRACDAWKDVDFPHVWQQVPSTQIFRDRFGFDTPNAVQLEMERICRSVEQPGILVLEAPMGIGKTEAALAAAEILARKSGRSGVFFALPTQATSNGIFPRLEDWVKKLNDGRHSIKLFHGKAQFNKDYIKLDNSMNIGDLEEDAVFVHEWCSGRKKSMLSDFVVGTIDQVLLACLKQKHVMMRHLGLANKVVIIDECHAYDAYMGIYLQRVLQWLGAYHVPVIILSATLPKETRKNVIRAYLNQKSQALNCATDDMYQEYGVQECEAWAESIAYPLMTYTDGQNVHSFSIDLHTRRSVIKMDSIDEPNMIELLQDKLSEGGCAGIIVNTVARAQAIAQQCAEIFGAGNVRLLHASFLMSDRTRIEHDITELLGKPKPNRQRPHKLIVVGTQVLEQSLDIDFDMMITDWCPMDLLLQRMGRLHRHSRSGRPQKVDTPVCYILNGEQPDFDKGTKAIYGSYLLVRTRSFLPKQIRIPDDISELVQKVYDEKVTIMPEPDNYTLAFDEYQKAISRKEGRAAAFCLTSPDIITRKKRSKRINRPVRTNGQSMVGCFDKKASDSEEGEETVRDIQQESIEVILLHEKDGMLCLFDDKGTIVTRNQIPDDKLALKIAQFTINLPSKMCYFGRAEKVVHALETISSAPEYQPFQKSKWLKGSLFLILDENNHTDLLDYSLTYSSQYGLQCYDKEDGNA